MTYEILRIFYGIYFLGIAFYFTHLVSNLLYDKKSIISKIGCLLSGTILIITWPFLVFSHSGRMKLINIINKL